MPTITLNDLTFSYTAEPLLDRITLHIGDGERACLVGPNGCGKSTMLRILAGHVTPDRGSATIDGVPAGAPPRLPDVVTFSGSVEEYLNAALAPLRDLVTRFDDVAIALAEAPDAPGLAHEYDTLLARMTAADVWSLDARADETLAGLGLAQLAGSGRGRQMGTLSPGQRTRVALAAVLLARPSVLLLDEPTNHLDDDAVRYLTGVLWEWSGPVLIASHDRAFIDDVATVIYDLNTASWQAVATADGAGRLPGAYRCSGGYADFLAAKDRARASHGELHAGQQAAKSSVRAHRESSRRIARGGARLAAAEGVSKKFFSDRAAATAVRRTRNDDRRLEALAEKEVRKPRRYALRMDLADAPDRAGLAISARSAAVAGRLAPVTLDLSYGEHLLVTGGNGAGKSTLIDWIVTGQPPAGARASGSVSRARGLAAVPQRLPRLGDAGFTEDVWRGGVGEIGTGVIHPSMWVTPIPELSAGNRRRAQLALVAAGDPEILLVDEPTNYLDLDTVEALEDALQGWNGTLVVASHDRWLIEHWRGRRLHLETDRGRHT